MTIVDSSSSSATAQKSLFPRASMDASLLRPCRDSESDVDDDDGDDERAWVLVGGRCCGTANVSVVTWSRAHRGIHIVVENLGSRSN